MSTPIYEPILHEIESLENIRKFCSELQTDIDLDIRAIDNRPFDGKNVGEIFGQAYAVMYGLINVIDKMAEIRLNNLPKRPLADD